MTLHIPPPAPARLEGQAIPLAIVHEDEHLLVVDKPAGLVVHPAPGHAEGTLVNALIAHCGDNLSGVGGERRPGIVHRLDKDTTGLMVVAKNDGAHMRLAAALAAREVRRDYLALVRGRPAPPSGEVTGAIGRNPANRKKMAVTGAGKPALTRYRTGHVWNDAAALLACSLATGRTHQIRVHMASIGHAVLGDPLYGGGRGLRPGQMPEPAGSAVAGLRRQALHAARLEFHHPATNVRHVFESAMPEDMQTLIRALDRTWPNDNRQRSAR